MLTFLNQGVSPYLKIDGWVGGKREGKSKYVEAKGNIL